MVMAAVAAAATIVKERSGNGVRIVPLDFSDGLVMG